MNLKYRYAHAWATIFSALFLKENALTLIYMKKRGERFQQDTLTNHI